ncbi:MAG TPA: hypothetical protein PKH69_07905 [Thiobacillaceae bacterium]|nr:hypothetical protein [Thiobacillaceae bacterium]HNU63976.1 hypothetical protein [Thiobacillaceae bacterium]
MSGIPEFSAADHRLVRATLGERFGAQVADAVEIKDVETEIRLSHADRELTVCPALFWIVGDCAFVLSRTGPAEYRAMFYYSVKERYGTGREDYDNLGDCVIGLLKAQEEEDARRQGEARASGR